MLAKRDCYIIFVLSVLQGIGRSDRMTVYRACIFSPRTLFGCWRLFGGRSRRVGRCRFGRALGQNFLDESRRNDGGQNGAIARLLDLKAAEESLYIGIGAVSSNAAFSGVKQSEKRGRLLGNVVCVFVTCSERLRAQVKSAEIASRNHRHGWLGKQKSPTAQSAKRTHLRPDAQNRETQARQWNPLIEPAE